MIEIFFMRVFQSVLQKSFLQDVRHNLWEILPGFSCRSGLRQLNPGEIYRKVGRTDCENERFSLIHADAWS